TRSKRDWSSDVCSSDLWLVFGLIVLVMGACGSAEDKGTQNDNSNEKSETVTIEHELGTTEVPKKPEKVVVFDFGILDTLDKLGRSEERRVGRVACRWYD